MVVVVVTRSYEEYEARAIAIATNPTLYRQLRDRVESLRHTAPLCDTTLWYVLTRHVCFGARANRRRRCCCWPW